MRRLTLEQLKNEPGGVLPPDAVLVPDRNVAFVSAQKKGPNVAFVVPLRKGDRPSGRGTRFSVMNTFTDFTLAGLTGAEVKVWLILFRDTKAGTGTARTGQTDLARRAGVNTRTVRRALAGLEARGLIVVVRRGRLNGGPSVYRVLPVSAAGVRHRTGNAG